MANKRKKTTAVVAGITAAALLLGGTFAWTSISQQAKNEAIVDINPGGRLHDDFDGKNKDVYVENFSSGATGVNIFARIRLDQYFEVGQDAGINKDAGDRKVNQILGTDINDVETWVTYKPGDDLGDTSKVQANDNWQWALGNGKDNLPYYMPTFDKNKDSLAADINGTYEGTVDGDIVHYDDFVKYGSADEAAVENSNIVNEVTAEEEHDWDSDTVWENDENNLYDNGGVIYDDSEPIDDGDVYKTTETHTAKPISTTATVISMAQWLDPDSEYYQVTGEFWIYDTDGWAYWAAPIEPETTTGLLLDSINMSRVPDDNYYYGINVVGQFATASDWTMLYEKTGTEKDAMTDGAKQLMQLITETTPAEDDNDITENGILTLRQDNADTETVTVGTELTVEMDATDLDPDATQPDLSDITISYTQYADENDEEGTTVTLEINTQYTYTYDEGTQTGTLTITDSTLEGERLNVQDNNGVVFGDVDVTSEDGGNDDDLTGGNGNYPLIMVDGNDVYEASYGHGATFTLSTADTIDGVSVTDAKLTIIRAPGEGVTITENEDGTITVVVNDVTAFPTESSFVINGSATLDGEAIGDYLGIWLYPDLRVNGISIYLPAAYAGGMSPGFGGQFTASSSDVTWSISGNQDNATQIDSSTGVLGIGNNETAETITLRVESTTDSNLYGTYELKILTDGMLSINATTADGTTKLVAKDVREDIQTVFSDTYAWTVSPESGLTVAEDGTLSATAAGTYTVTATSNSNYRVTASIEVTVNDDITITVSTTAE